LRLAIGWRQPLSFYFDATQRSLRNYRPGRKAGSNSRGICSCKSFSPSGMSLSRCRATPTGCRGFPTPHTHTHTR
jgi:hypothetical protein